MLSTANSRQKTKSATVSINGHRHKHIRTARDGVALYLNNFTDRLHFFRQKRLQTRSVKCVHVRVEWGRERACNRAEVGAGHRKVAEALCPADRLADGMATTTPRAAAATFWTLALSSALLSPCHRGEGNGGVSGQTLREQAPTLAKKAFVGLPYARMAKSKHGQQGFGTKHWPRLCVQSGLSNVWFPFLADSLTTDGFIRRQRLVVEEVLHY